MTAGLLQISGVVVDLVYSVDAVPKAGEEAIVRDFAIKPGGGFNAMIASKRAGMDVYYGGALGTGPFASIVRNALDAEAIPVLRSQDMARDQGCCTVMVDRQGERTFLASDGAEGHATIDDLKQVTASNFDWMLLSGYALHYRGSCPAIFDWLQREAPFPGLIFDPSPVVAALPANVLAAARARATWISANSHEAAVMTGLSDSMQSAKELARNAPENGGAIVRDGKHGCIVATHEICISVPAFPVTPVDTNGAGDTHLGCFIARLARGDTPVAAAHYANVAAALSTTRPGPATAPFENEVITALGRQQQQNSTSRAEEELLPTQSQ